MEHSIGLVRTLSHHRTTSKALLMVMAFQRPLSPNNDPGTPQLDTQNLLGRIEELEKTLRTIGELSNKNLTSKADSACLANGEPTEATVTREIANDRRSASDRLSVDANTATGLRWSASAKRVEVRRLEKNWHTFDEASDPSLLLLDRATPIIDPLRDISFLSVDAEGCMSISPPELFQAQRLLERGTHSMAIYVPVLDCPRLGNKDLQIITANSQTMVFKRCDMAMISQLLTLLAVGSRVDCIGNAEGMPCQDWTFYKQGFTLMSDSSSEVPRLLELAEYHLLRCTYLMQAERPVSAMDAIWNATRIALHAGRNNQPSWGDCTPSEKLYRQRLCGRSTLWSEELRRNVASRTS